VFQKTAGFLLFLAAGFGFLAGGFPGALTGFLAVLAIGSGLAISVSEAGTGVHEVFRIRAVQRIGGILIAALSALGLYRGGWAWGWLWVLVAYLGTTGLVAVIGLAVGGLGRKGDSRVGRPSFPTAFDLNKQDDVALLDSVRESFGLFLADESAAYHSCMYRPEAELPFPKKTIQAAIEAMLDFAEGRRESFWLNEELRDPAVVELLRSGLAHLEFFIDIPPSALPTDPRENGRVAVQFLSDQDERLGR
jgi:hypothetical protein